MRALLVFATLVCVISMVVVCMASAHHVLGFSEHFTGRTFMSDVSASWRTDGIPKIIHQIAPKDRSKWPEAWSVCHKTWKDGLAGHEHRLWSDEEDIDRFVKEKFSDFYPVYASFPNKIQRIDAVRYLILYEYGGIYADMDYCMMKDFTRSAHISKGKGKASVTESPHENEKYQNSLMMSPAKHPFWKLVIREIIDYRAGGGDMANIIASTGPNLIDRVVSRLEGADAGMFNALPSKLFNPSATLRSLDAIKADNPLTKDAFCVHIGTAAWTE